MEQTRGQNQTNEVNQQNSDPNHEQQVEFATNTTTSTSIQTHTVISLSIVISAICIILWTYLYAHDNMIEFLSLCLTLTITVAGSLSIVYRLTNKNALERQIFDLLNAHPFIPLMWLVVSVIVFLIILQSPNKHVAFDNNKVIEVSTSEPQEQLDKELVPDCYVTVTARMGANLRPIPRSNLLDPEATAQRDERVHVDRYTVNFYDETWYRQVETQLWIAESVVSVEVICDCLAYLKTTYSRSQPV